MSRPLPPFPPSDLAMEYSDWSGRVVGKPEYLTCRVHFTPDGGKELAYEVNVNGLWRNRGRGRGTRRVYEGYVGTDESTGDELYALGIVRIERLVGETKATVAPVPREYVICCLQSMGAPGLRKVRYRIDKDYHSTSKSRPAELGAFSPAEPDCKQCIDFVRFTKTYIRKAESERLLYCRLAKPCPEHGHKDDLRRWRIAKPKIHISHQIYEALGIGSREYKFR